MNFLRDYKYTWWQIGIFKITMLTLGILIGSNWPEVFQGYWAALLAIWVVTLIYINYISFKQIK